MEVGWSKDTISFCIITTILAEMIYENFNKGIIYQHGYFVCHDETLLGKCAIQLNPGIDFCMSPANERWQCNATSSLIGWARLQTVPWKPMTLY